MKEFLSDEWCKAVTAEATDLPPEVVGSEPFTLRVEVAPLPDSSPSLPPSGYQAVAIGGHLSITPLHKSSAPADQQGPTVVLALDMPTAVALAMGTTSVATALASGRIKVRGDATVLSLRAATVAGLGVVTRRVRTKTRFPAQKEGP